MLTKRLIPCLDVSGGMVVKGVQFQSLKTLADPVSLAAYYNDSGADELVFYDISATVEDLNLRQDWISAVAKEVQIPFTVGGGIRTLEDVYKVLAAGADKISINSAALQTPDLITQAAKQFGSQCLVVSMDVNLLPDQSYAVFVKGGQVPTSLNPIDWAKAAVDLGAGELVINAIHCDGMGEGYDLSLLKALASQVQVPVIASGGAGRREDFADVFQHAPVEGALAASLFHSKTLSLPSLKAYLYSMGLPIRL